MRTLILCLLAFYAAAKPPDNGSKELLVEDAGLARDACSDTKPSQWCQRKCGTPAKCTSNKCTNKCRSSCGLCLTTSTTADPTTTTTPTTNAPTTCPPPPPPSPCPTVPACPSVPTCPTTPTTQIPSTTTTTPTQSLGMALMVISAECEEYDYYNYWEWPMPDCLNPERNTIRIETLENPVPPCLWSLNPSINPLKPITSSVGIVLDGEPHICGGYTDERETEWSTKCYRYNSAQDSWAINGYMSMHTSTKDSVATYDSTYGWLMSGVISDSYGMESGDEVLTFSKDGKSFGTFPVPWSDGKTRCLQTLDNGGDIFVLAGRSWYNEDMNDTYIFRSSNSTWEPQPGLPDMACLSCQGQGLYGTVNDVRGCGPVRPEPGSSIKEIVVLLATLNGYTFNIFDIVTSSWRTTNKTIPPPSSSVYEEDKLTTVQYESTFLLFDSTSTIFYKYDSAEEDFLQMPVKMSKPIGGGSPILVSLDNFPTITTSTVGSGKALMAIQHDRWRKFRNQIEIETLDDPVPSSLSIKRPFNALNEFPNFSDGSEEYLQGAHGAVLDGVPYLCGMVYLIYNTVFASTSAKCYGYNGTTDSWDFSGNMSISTYHPYDGVSQGATYDSTHGWVMGGWSTFEDDGGERQHLLEKTKDGKTFEPFPSLPDEGASCLETLDNGGDIFATGSGSAANRAYIFRSSISAWKRQPDVPEPVSDWQAQACGPVRYDPSSSIDEIVVLVGAKVFIFNLDHSFWVAANDLDRAFSNVFTIPYGSSFLLFEPEDPTIYQFNEYDEQFQPMPVNMSVPLDGATPLIVDLDIFSICGEEAGTVSSMDNSYEELRFEDNRLAKDTSGAPLTCPPPPPPPTCPPPPSCPTVPPCPTTTTTLVPSTTTTTSTPTTPPTLSGYALMVIGTNDDYNHNDDDYDNDGVINSVRIETLDDPVPPCLWSLNPSINQSEPISSHIASVLDGVPHLCTMTTQFSYMYGEDFPTSECYRYNASLDSWTISGRMMNVSKSPYYGATYDMTHGWLMWVNKWSWLDNEWGGGWQYPPSTALQYTKDGKTFGTFPVPRWVEGVGGECLETLDNGGDIFMAGRTSAYIYRNSDSTWERQPEVPWYHDGTEGGTQVCGPVRSSPGSSIEEIVVLVRNNIHNQEYAVYILDIGASSWRAANENVTLNDLGSGCFTSTGWPEPCDNIHVTTVPYESTFLLFLSSETTFFKYDRAEEEFLQMPVSMFKPIGGGTPLLVNLDNFPPTTITPGLPGKALMAVGSGNATRIETVDNQVPSSERIRRPFDALNGEYLCSAIGTVLDGVPHLCGTPPSDDWYEPCNHNYLYYNSAPSMCYNYNATFDSWTFTGNVSIQPEFGASTYDSVHGWVIGGRTVEYEDVDNREYLLEKTKDGRSFEPFPSLPDDFTIYGAMSMSGVTCLETLNNGGDIFVTGSGRNTTYIFRTNTSTWERQPDVPREYPRVRGCGPVRANATSSVEEIVVIDAIWNSGFHTYVHIFTISTSSWRRAANDLPDSIRYDKGFPTVPYGSSFLLFNSQYDGVNDPTIYRYDAAEEEFHPLAVNMSEPLNGATPILVDLDMFPGCSVDARAP